MKRNSIYAALLLSSLSLWTGCASHNPDGKQITLKPSAQVLTPDSSHRLVMDLTCHVPARYLSRRSRLFITPQLVVGDSVVGECLPLVLDAPVYSKKLKRREKLEGYQDIWQGHARQLPTTARPFHYVYRDSLQMPEGVDGGRLIAVVSADGCGSCSSLDTLRMASISNPITLMPDMRESVVLSLMKRDFKPEPKIMKGKGVAHLQFIINLYDINLTLGNNRAELDTMVRKLTPVLRDTLSTLNALSIYGMASADGSLPFNTALSRNRALSAKNWLVGQLRIPVQVQRLITVDSRPEGWSPVLQAMVADGHPDSVAVRQILEKYAGKNDDVQEYWIRRLPCWNDIKDRYLQKDRKVEYVYSYTLKSFTTARELLTMFEKRPDAFSENEMLQVAELKETEAEKCRVYETVLQYFPQSEVAANNLAVLYLQQGTHTGALKVLNRIQQASPALQNTRAAACLYAGDYEQALLLLQQLKQPEARYNYGLLCASQRKVAEAYRLLRPFEDLNSAILALCVNDNREARRILDKLDDPSPLADYVRALTAARLNDEAACYRGLRQACTDVRLRRRAQSEPEFEGYLASPRFRELLFTETEAKKGADR